MQSDIRCGGETWSVPNYSNYSKYCASTKWGSLFQRSQPRHLAVAARTLLVLVALQFPVIGHCDSGNGWFNFFGAKGKDMKEVATKVATLNEDKMIWALEFSPDTKHVVTISRYGKDIIHIWDWHNGKIAHTLDLVNGADIGQTTEPISYSPDGKLLAVCHDRASQFIVARIWNTETWDVVHDIDEPSGGGGCDAAAFTPDGKSFIRVLYKISSFSGDNLIIYNTATWQPVWGMRTVLPVTMPDIDRKRANAEGTAFNPNTLAMSPDGKQLALGGEVWADSFFNAEIKIVDIEKRAIAKTIKAFSNPVELGESVARLAWNPDGTQITAGIFGVNKDGGDAVRIFNVQDGEQVANEPASLGTQIRGLRYTPDGKYLLEAGIGHSLEIWDGKHQKLLQEISEGGVVESVAVSADGQYFAIGIRDDRKVQVWKLK